MQSGGCATVPTANAMESGARGNASFFLDAL
jgi:hypothetical protein